MTNQVKLSMEELQVASFSEVINREEQLELFGGSGLDDLFKWLAGMLNSTVEAIAGLFGSTSGSNNNNNNNNNTNTVVGWGNTITWTTSPSGTTVTLYEVDSVKIGSYTAYGVDSMTVK